MSRRGYRKNICLPLVRCPRILPQPKLERLRAHNESSASDRRGRRGHLGIKARPVGLVASYRSLRLEPDEDVVGVIERLDESLYVPLILVRT